MGYPDRRVHPEWEERFPWLAQGTTTRGDGSYVADFSLSSPALVGASGSWTKTPDPWKALTHAAGFRHLALTRQVHGAGIHVHWTRETEGLRFEGDADGHVSAQPGLLLGVTVADCVPVFLVAPAQRVVGLLHAGWRGAAEGVLEEGLRTLRSAFGAGPNDVFLHLGPAICGSCYEVGPEVHAALGLSVPSQAEPVDLRGVLAGRALALGVPGNRITRSSFCTRCGASPFYSHRNGHRQRQMAFLGVRGS